MFTFGINVRLYKNSIINGRNVQRKNVVNNVRFNNGHHDKMARTKTHSTSQNRKYTKDATDIKK